jgi:hypothetical protein
MSSANALTRAEYSAFVEASKGRISKTEFLKRFMVYHFVIPNLIQIIANGFNFDEEDHVRASLMGSMNGLLLFGDALDAAYGLLLGQDMFRTGIRHPLGFTEDVYKFANNVGDTKWSDFVNGSKAISGATKTVDAITGLPASTLMNMGRGLYKVPTRKVPEGLNLMLGYAPYTIKKNKLDR